MEGLTSQLSLQSSFSLLEISYMVQEKPQLLCGCGLGTGATSTKGKRVWFLILGNKGRKDATGEVGVGCRRSQPAA